MSKATRKEVYVALDSERVYQELRRKQRKWANSQSVGEYLTLMRFYLSMADEAWACNGEAMALEFVRKLAGIGVACMEENGAPMRKIPDDLKSFLPKT